MIRLFKNRLAAMRHVTFDNSLFHYQLRCFSIYTWLNLATFLALLLILYCAAARLSHFQELQRFTSSMPPFLLEEQLNSEAYTTLFVSPKNVGFSTFTFFTEAFLGILQSFGVLALFLIVTIEAIKSSLAWDKKRWNHPDSPEIRVLPVSRSQLQFAFRDLRFFARSLCFLLGILSLMLPAPDIGAITLSSHFLFKVMLVGWIFIFAGLRTDQLQKSCGKNLLKNPMYPYWTIAILIPIILPFILVTVIVSIIGVEYYRAMELAWNYSIFAGAFALLVSCWMMKGRLLKQYEGDADER